MDRLKNATRDLTVLKSSPSINRMRSDPETMDAFNEAVNVGNRWKERVDRASVESLDDASLLPLVTFGERIVAIVNGNQTGGVTFSNAIRQAINNLANALPALSVALLDDQGVFETFERLEATTMQSLKSLSQSESDATSQLKATATELEAGIKSTSEQATKDYLFAKEAASRIVVDQARKQFEGADEYLRGKALQWSLLTYFMFGALIVLLLRFFYSPPAIIRAIEEMIWSSNGKALAQTLSIPLLITASAYFTTLRLALIGVLGAGLTVCVRMMRAYTHMVEHNKHKLRVTNSIEAFVAAVRTQESKDVVLAKLVESVTAFGDTGILGKQAETTALPSIILEAITKNVGKAD
jgi:hypothetical protein